MVMYQAMLRSTKEQVQLLQQQQQHQQDQVGVGAKDVLVVGRAVR